MISPDSAGDISIKQEPEDIYIKQEEPEDHPQLSMYSYYSIIVTEHITISGYYRPKKDFYARLLAYIHILLKKTYFSFHYYDHIMG